MRPPPGFSVQQQKRDGTGRPFFCSTGAALQQFKLLRAKAAGTFGGLFFCQLVHKLLHAPCTEDPLMMRRKVNIKNFNSSPMSV